MESLKAAVRAYGPRHADSDGLAFTPVPGLRMMCVEQSRGDLHSVYRPLLCLVLQGAKQLSVGAESRLISAGDSVVVAADMPVVGRVVQASPHAPYLAVAVELEMGLLREMSAHLDASPAVTKAAWETLFTTDSDASVLDCAERLMRLIDRPAAVPLLRPGIMREIHYWLLSGPHGSRLRSLADPESHSGRLAAAVALLRTDYKKRVAVERLASAAAMSLTAFHKHFKHMTSLTPGQFQKRLRLIEARRLMLEEGLSATSAAFEVGYESPSQFTRDYGRLFKAPPKRDVLRARSGSLARNLKEGGRAEA
jgi:AraC-like DNA-binding protein